MLVLRFKEITEKIGKLPITDLLFNFSRVDKSFEDYLIKNFGDVKDVEIKFNELFDRYVRYDPVLEEPLIGASKCVERKIESLWDKLGFYRRDTRRVYICEDLIEQEAEKIRSKLNLNYDKFEIYNIVREFVRLHEHIHAYIHKILEDKKIPNYIEEPLTVFVEYSVAYDYIRSDKDLKTIFDYLDGNAPKHYQDWRKLLNIKGRDDWEVVLNYEETGVLVLTTLMLLEKLRKEDKTYSSFEHYIDENRIVIEKLIDFITIFHLFD